MGSWLISIELFTSRNVPKSLFTRYKCRNIVALYKLMSSGPACAGVVHREGG